jgi:hypothetical protein
MGSYRAKRRAKYTSQKVPDNSAVLNSLLLDTAEQVKTEMA